MYKIYKSQISIELIYLSHQKMLFDNREKVIIQSDNIFIFESFDLLKISKDNVFILESSISLYVILQCLSRFKTVYLINGILNHFENEFVRQISDINNFEIINFMFD